MIINTILARRINNQHTIDELVYRVHTNGKMLRINEHACESNKTSYTLGTLGMKYQKRICTCYCTTHRKEGTIPCQGCKNKDIHCEELHTLIDWE